MELHELIESVGEIKAKYNTLNRIEGGRKWGLTEYSQALVGDVGDLQKLLLAKKGYRFSKSDVERELTAELADCLWSILAIADELDIDIERALQKHLDKLSSKIVEHKVVKPKRVTL